MAATDIKVTEILYAPSATGAQDKLYEWVEIQNTGATAVSLNGWKLDDSLTANAGIGSLGNATLQAGEIAILYNGNITPAQFMAANPTLVPGTVLIPVSNWQQINNGASGDTVNLYDNTASLITSVPYVDDASAGQSLSYTSTGIYEGAGAPDPGAVTCFTTGSIIDTAQGPRRIEELQVGDQIRTMDHGLQTLRWIGRRVVLLDEQARTPALCPVEIEKGALGPHAPLRRTRVSPQHRMLITNTATSALFGQPHMLCAAISLVGQAGIRQLSPAEVVEYVHILFDQHEVVFVDGQASESFYPSEDGISALSPLAREELFRLFPEVKSAAFPVAYPVMSSAEAALLNQ
jgi:hypothetical protein